MTNQRLKNIDTTGIWGALRLHVRKVPRLVTSESTVKKVREAAEHDEPLGIIISRGDRGEQRPVFSAYIWGPAPEPITESATKVA